MALLEREAYLGRLSILLADARRGHGHLALVAGEAGIGKTALVHAFFALAPAATRLLWGTCDPLVPARPFTPIVDIADQVGGDLRQAMAGGDRDDVIETFLGLLQRPGAPPTIVVMDDLHWADEATLDLLRVVGRRISRLAALVIGTYRDHEVGHGHPLRIALGDIPAGASTELVLTGLSVEAVARLASGRMGDAVAIHRATGGNPFYVSEVLAGGGREVPTTVRDAVLARVERLTADAREVVRAASVLGPGCDVPTLLRVASRARPALEEAAARALLEIRAESVAFRHELGRRAVLDALPTPERVAINRRALEVLASVPDVDPARVARHAIAAGDSAAILELAPRAGARAASLGAHREAAAFFAAAVEVAGVLDDRPRAELLEAFARECSLTDDIPRALDAQQAALQAWRRVGDPIREALALTELSMFLWLAGFSEESLSAALSAERLLEVHAPESPELARACAVVAQRQAIAGLDLLGRDKAISALELAERLGDERTAVHALTTLSVIKIFAGEPAGWATLEDAVTRATAADLPEETARALVNLVETARDLRRYDMAERYLAAATAHLEEREIDLFSHLLMSRLAGFETDTGRWDGALAHAASLLDRDGIAAPIRVRALVTRGLIKARRGGHAPWADLDEGLALAGSDGQELVPLRAARAEAAWLEGRDGQAREEAARGLDLGPRESSPWWWSELAFWGWKAGARAPLPDPDEPPFWLHAAGRPAEASAAWAAIGAPYMEALALADSDDEADLRRSLRLLNRLGARPMARRVVNRLRNLGAARIDRGPRPETLRNPAGLTARQLEILGLVSAGLGNADIARHLVISPKTVDHHVSAILRKLGVSNRAAAADAARRLRLSDRALQDGEIVAAR